MNINYILLLHKNSLQAKHLIEKLSEKWTYFYLHVDRNIDIKPFKEEFKSLKHITFLENNNRYPGTWGDMGIVKATLSAMRKIVEDKGSGYTILMSGQDYPLRSNKYIYNFLNNSDLFYIDFQSIAEKWGEHAYERIEKYKINKSMRRGDFMLLPSIYDKDFYCKRTLGQLNYLRKKNRIREMFKIFYRRTFPNNLAPYGGSQWWALPTKIIEPILSYVDNNPEFIEYNKYSLLPDEFFFQSIINDIVDDKSKILPSLTYTNWERKGEPLPVTFKDRDLRELGKAASKHLFARKFDTSIDEKILKSIDKSLLK